jgi:hypothetical protein
LRVLLLRWGDVEIFSRSHRKNAIDGIYGKSAKTRCVGVNGGFLVLKNRVLRGSDEPCRPSELGEVCLWEIDVLHCRAHVRNRRPPNAIKHVAQSVAGADSPLSAL